MSSPLNTPSPNSEDGDDKSRRVCEPPKEVPGRICAVCGDRANGYNFGVLTCESCKAFFRRNAAREEEIKCPFSNSCQITSASRRFCQACRLTKCFTVGMSNECLVEKPRSSKRKKIILKEEGAEEDENVSVSKSFLRQLMNKADEKSSSCKCTCTCGFYSSGTKLTAVVEEKAKEVQVPHPPSSILGKTNPTYGPGEPSGQFCTLGSPQDSDQRKASESFNYSSPSCFTSSCCSPSCGFSMMSQPSPASFPPPTTFLPSPLSICSAQEFEDKYNCRPPFLPRADRQQRFQFRADVDYYRNLMNTMVQSGYGPLLERIQKCTAKYTTLTSDEMFLLQELHVMNEPLKAPLDNNYAQDNLPGVLKIAQEAIQRIIRMTATLKAFQELQTEDKMRIIKSVFSELLIMRGVMAYDRKNDTWSHYFATDKMEVRLDVLKGTTDPGHYNEHKMFVQSFSEDIRSNDNIMLLVMAIVIFRPELSSLRNQAQVCSTQRMYFQILLKVLETDFPKEQAHKTYDNLLQRVVDLSVVNRSMTRVLYGFDPSLFDPLFKELFDIYPNSVI